MLGTGPAGGGATCSRIDGDSETNVWKSNSCCETLHPAACQLHVGPVGGRARAREAEGRERLAGADVDALRLGDAGQFHQRGRERRLQGERLPERRRRAALLVAPQHRLDARHGRDARIAEPLLGEREAPPRHGPRGRQLRGPLELRGRVVEVAAAGQLAEPERHQPQLEVEQRAVAMLLRDFHQLGLAPEQRQRVRFGGECRARRQQARDGLATLRPCRWGEGEEREGGQEPERSRMRMHVRHTR